MEKEDQFTPEQIATMLFLVEVYQELKHMAETDDHIAESIATAWQIVYHQNQNKGIKDNESRNNGE